MATAPSSCLDLVSPTLLRNTTTTTLRAYFCEGFASSENLIKRLNETVKVRKCLDLFVIRTRFLVVVLLLLFAIIPCYSPRVFLRKLEGFASSENLIQRQTIKKSSFKTTERRSNVRRCELRRVLENRRDVVLEVRQRVRRNRSRRAQGAALVQGIITLVSFSFRSRIDRSIFLFPVAFFADTSLSLFQKARARDAVYFKAQKYVKGSPEAAVITEVIPAEIPK